MMDESLLSQLERSCPVTLPMHMPGHKRNADLAPYLKALRADIDITEIAGFDHLHAPGGVLKQAMARASKVYRSGHSFFLVNGSTVGILAAIRSTTQPGDTILVARNCHRSVYHAIALNGLKPIFIYPETDEQFQVLASLKIEHIRKAILANRKARVLMITSPTYEGVVSDLDKICALAHHHGLTVIVDEAHGAHLGFSSFFPKNAVSSGADIVIQSLHKTLPSLTQTALAHVLSPALAYEMQRQLSVFETTSPSYLLLSSIDGCVRLLDEKAGPLFMDWQEALEEFDRKITKLKHLRILGHGTDKKLKHSKIFSHDPSKIFVSTLRSSIDGHDLAQILREDYATEPEMIAPQAILGMTGLGETKETLSRFADILLEIDRRISAAPYKKASLIVPRARTAMPLSKAERAPFRLIPLAEASGAIVAEMITVYPPGIPVLIPGEIISEQAVRYMLAAVDAENTILRSRSDVDGSIAVYRESALNVDSM